MLVIFDDNDSNPTQVYSHDLGNLEKNLTIVMTLRPEIQSRCIQIFL